MRRMFEMARDLGRRTTPAADTGRQQVERLDQPISDYPDTFVADLAGLSRTVALTADLSIDPFDSLETPLQQGEEMTAVSPTASFLPSDESYSLDSILDEFGQTAFVEDVHPRFMDDTDVEEYYSEDIGATLSVPDSSTRPVPDGDFSKKYQDRDGYTYDEKSKFWQTPVPGVSVSADGVHGDNLLDKSQREGMVKEYIREDLKNQGVGPAEIDRIMAGELEDIGRALAAEGITVNMQLSLDNPTGPQAKQIQQAMQLTLNKLGDSVHYSLDKNAPAPPPDSKTPKGLKQQLVELTDEKQIERITKQIEKLESASAPEPKPRSDKRSSEEIREALTVVKEDLAARQAAASTTSPPSADLSTTEDRSHSRK